MRTHAQKFNTFFCIQIWKKNIILILFNGEPSMFLVTIFASQIIGGERELLWLSGDIK